MDTLWQDVRFAARSLGKHRLFTLVAVLTLALGIGANTAIFSVVDGVLLRPLPYGDAGRLYSIWTAPEATPSDQNPASLPDVRDWQSANTGFSGIAAYGFNRVQLSGPEGSEPIRAVLGTATLFDVLRAAPVLGRVPRPADDRLPVVAISYRIWMRHFGGDSSVVGRTVNLGGDPFTVIGVMPLGFHFPTPDIDAWTSLYGIYKTSGRGGVGDWIDNRGLHGYLVVGRLAPGATAAGATAAMNRVETGLARAYPASDKGTVIHLVSIRDQTVGGVARLLWVMLGAAGFVLLLACANVAHLALARATERTREMAVRRALGAPRRRLVRQLITESLVLAAAGGAAGVLLAMWAVALLVRLSPADIPRIETVGVNAQVLGYAAAVSLLTGVLFGLAPALTSWRHDPQMALRDQGRGLTRGRGSGRLRSWLVAAETAVALMLLVGAGLMVRSFAKLSHADPGFDPNGVLAFGALFDLNRYSDVSKQVVTMDELLARIRAIPGVTSAGAGTSMPPSHVQQSQVFSVVGRQAPDPGHAPTAWFVPATPGYLATLGIPVTAGRDFTTADDGHTPLVMIVNGELARRTFPNQDPLGQQLTVGGVTRTIVGVTGDPTFNGIGAPAAPAVFVPYAQAPFPGVWFAVRTRGTPALLAGAVRDAFHAVDPQLDPIAMKPMGAMMGDEFIRPRFQTWLLATFGTLAMVLAAIGIYGVVAYSVVQRTGELGLRLALGAPTGRVLGMVVRQGMLPVAAGLAAGIVGSVALSRLMTGLLYGITATDRPTFVAVALALAVVALAAAYLPARRAARVDPLVALRSE